MSIRETMIQAFRDWARDALGITDDEIYPAGRGRPDVFGPAPCLVVDVLVVGRSTGTVHRRTTPAGRVFDSARTAELSVIGYGPGTDDWLEILAARHEEATAYGPFSFVPLGDTLDVSGPVESEIEERYQRTFTAQYRSIVGAPAPTPRVQVLYNNDPMLPPTP